MAKAWTLKSSWYRYPSLAYTRGRADPREMERAYKAWIEARDSLPPELFRERFGY